MILFLISYKFLQYIHAVITDKLLYFYIGAQPQ